MLDKIEAGSRRFNRKLTLIVCGSTLIFLAFLITSEAVVRNLFQFSFLATMELSQIIVVWVVFPAFAYALIADSHVRVTLITNLLPGRVRAGMDAFTYLTGTIFFAGFSYFAWPYFWESWKIREVPMAPIELPLYMAKLAMPIGTSLMAIQFLILLLRTLHPSSPKGGKEAA